MKKILGISLALAAPAAAAHGGHVDGFVIGLGAGLMMALAGLVAWRLQRLKITRAPESPPPVVPAQAGTHADSPGTRL